MRWPVLLVLRTGLQANLMATATCDLWKGQTSYSCNADEQITFP